MGRMAEVLLRCLLRKGALRPQIPDLERLLLREAGRHHLAEHPHQDLVGERPVIPVHHHAQHLSLALGAVVVDRSLERPLGLAHLLRPLRALGDQGLDAAIDAIDARPHLAQVGSGCRALGRIGLLLARRFGRFARCHHTIRTERMPSIAAIWPSTVASTSLSVSTRV
jgi:hypothetical protein